MNDLLTADELAVRLKVKPETIRRWARAGIIPFMKLSAKIIRFDALTVQQALTNLAAKGGGNE